MWPISWHTACVQHLHMLDLNLRCYAASSIFMLQKCMYTADALCTSGKAVQSNIEQLHHMQDDDNIMTNIGDHF